jgi:hypothetical protein
MPNYPTTANERLRLANELTACGLKPTQTKPHFDRAKIDTMIEAMLDYSFDYNASSLQPLILGPNDEILGGHHRVIAAHLAGLDLTSIPTVLPQVQRLPINYRPTYGWLDVLPD